MATTRYVTILTKQSNQPSAALPASAATGEGFINTADGKLYYKGFISGTGSTTYLPSLLDSAFFEVGAHVSQLKIDGGIVGYSGQSGSGLVGKFLSGTTSGFVLADISSIVGVDSYVTGGTFSNNTRALTLNINNGKPSVTVTGFGDTTTTGGTFVNNTLVLTNSTGGTVSTLINNFSGITTTGTVTAAIISATTISGGTIYGDGSNLTGVQDNNRYITGGTFTNNNLILTDNSGTSVTTFINNFSGITVNGNATITGNTNISGNTTIVGNMSAANISTASNGSATIGTGGMTIGSGGSPSVAGTGDLVVHGNLTIFGGTISAFTGELYVEDKNIILNYNPTGDTYSTSLGAGFSVQDGLGVSAATGDTVFYQIAETGTPSSVADAYGKRFWESNLFNIMLGSSGGTGTGLYVLRETDILNGGTY
jgi:hypothetical protein